MKRLTPIYIFLFFIIATSSKGQSTNYPQNYFRPPLDIPIRLAGDFGEIRPNHFHTGIDIKTNDHTGLKVHALADGYVSRIKVSPWGYGHALYITYPNGYVSVFGHLSRFNDTIQKYIKEEQYAQRSFAVDVYLKPGEIPVKKGEVVAYSGNTGSSTAPHLHFEIRDEKSEHPLNPLLFGFKVEDTRKPIVHGIGVYPLSDSSEVNHSRKSVKRRVYPIHGVYSLKNNEVIEVHGPTGFAVSTYDQTNGQANHNGVYSIELQLDGQKVFQTQINELNFAKMRYVNAYIDYAEKEHYRHTYQRSFLVKNNTLKVYKYVKNKGVINFTDNKIHTLTYTIKDYYGNTSTCTFKVHSSPDRVSPDTTRPKHFVAFFPCDKQNYYETSHVSINMPANTLFQDLPFQYYTSGSSIKGLYGPVHHIESKYVPVLSYYSLSIKPVNLPKQLESRAVIVAVNGRHVASEGGTWKDDYISTQVRTMGDFSVMVDTIPPHIKPYNIYPNKNMHNSRAIEVKFWDNLSGMKSFVGTIDGQWVLMEYAPKRDMLFYRFDGHLKPGKHHFKLQITDGVGNSSTYETNFIR